MGRERRRRFGHVHSLFSLTIFPLSLTIVLLYALTFSLNPHPSLSAFRILPSVSILVATFNKGPYIGRAIRSALAQTLPDIEVVISDDCSTDNTSAIVRQFARLDFRVHFWRTAEQIYQNSNRWHVLQRSTGSFVLILDSDDELCNQTAEIDLANAMVHSADMVEHRAVQYSDAKGFEPWVFRRPLFTNGTNVTLANAFLRSAINWNLWLKMIKRSVYIKAMTLVGPAVCREPLQITVDRLHLGVVYRFVSRYIAIEFVGYIYYVNVPDNSRTRCPMPGRLAHHQRIDEILKEVYAMRIS
jgi:glycosyltransferase involved in cell wall biosynthesis